MKVKGPNPARIFSRAISNSAPNIAQRALI